MNGQDGATGAVGREEGKGGREAGQLGERGLVEVKNSWTLWCWRTWQGSAVRHLGAGRETGQQGNRQGVRQTQGSQIKSTYILCPLFDSQTTRKQVAADSKMRRSSLSLSIAYTSPYMICLKSFNAAGLWISP